MFTQADLFTKYISMTLLIDSFEFKLPETVELFKLPILTLIEPAQIVARHFESSIFIYSDYFDP